MTNNFPQISIDNQGKAKFILNIVKHNNCLTDRLARSTIKWLLPKFEEQLEAGNKIAISNGELVYVFTDKRPYLLRANSLQDEIEDYNLGYYLLEKEDSLSKVLLQEKQVFPVEAFFYSLARGDYDMVHSRQS